MARRRARPCHTKSGWVTRSCKSCKSPTGSDHNTQRPPTLAGHISTNSAFWSGVSKASFSGFISMTGSNLYVATATGDHLACSLAMPFFATAVSCMRCPALGARGGGRGAGGRWVSSHGCGSDHLPSGKGGAQRSLNAFKGIISVLEDEQNT